jgi:ADP-ribose pyrophosphatase YjhB (NUDIX family)
MFNTGRKELEMVLTYLVQDNKVLLAKMLKQSLHKVNGYGGKVNEGENDVKEVACRELLEESEVVVAPEDLLEAALLDITHEDKGIHITLHVFLAKKWTGTPVETDEMGEPEWFDFDNLPYDLMWPDDRHWLLRALKGERLKVDLLFTDEGKTLKNVAVEELKILKWKFS